MGQEMPSARNQYRIKEYTSGWNRRHEGAGHSKWVKAAALYVGIIVFVYAALTFDGFSARQNFTFAILIVFGLGFFAWLQSNTANGELRRAARPVWRLTPFRVMVFPRWHEILTDFKLIGETEEWDPIEKSLPPANFCFTMLQERKISSARWSTTTSIAVSLARLTSQRPSNQ
jgi:hypothetical protein